MTTKIHSFRIRIMGPDLDTYDTSEQFDASNQLAINDLNESDAVSNIEDVINDELPEGYYCKLEEG